MHCRALSSSSFARLRHQIIVQQAVLLAINAFEPNCVQAPSHCRLEQLYIAAAEQQLTRKLYKPSPFPCTAGHTVLRLAVAAGPLCVLR